MVATKRRFRKLSARAKALLAHQEGMDVEFKQSPSGLDASDIVAFANSKSGGTILIGVKEERAENGPQTARIVGCAIGDNAKLQVLDKAFSYVPPVPVELFAENVSGTGFLRLEIPSGVDRPYCTSGGTYKTREDGRVRALTPSDLLEILIEREARLFEERFRNSSARLVEEIQSTAASVAKINATIKKQSKASRPLSSGPT